MMTFLSFIGAIYIAIIAAYYTISWHEDWKEEKKRESYKKAVKK